MKGIAWQTKTSRITQKHRSMRKFAVIRGGFTGRAWLETGFELFLKHCVVGRPDRDFWLLEATGNDKFQETWFGYEQFYRWIKNSLTELIQDAGGVPKLKDWKKIVSTITPHSGRVVIPDLAAVHGSQPYMINAQAGWKDSMITKYGRSGDMISLNMMRELLEDIKIDDNEIRNDDQDGKEPASDQEGPSPKKVPDHCDGGEDSDQEDRPVFFRMIGRTSGDLAKQRAHVRDLKNPDKSACSLMMMRDLEVMGTDAPNQICKRCAKYRPEIRRVI
jgi:hypothetical protein